MRDALNRGPHHLRTSADIVTLAASGDEETIALVEEVGETIGYALADAVGLLNPSAVIIGGNLSEVGERFIGAIRRSIFGASHVFARQGLTVERARLGEKAGVHGASLLAQDALFDAERISVLTRPAARD